jgi:hypothetical protein
MKAIIQSLTHPFLAILALAALTNLGFGQQRERLLDWRPLPMPVDNRVNGQPTEWEPLQLLEITVDGRPITCGQPFVGDVDWLKSLTFKIRNVSGKNVKFIRIYFTVPEAKFKDSTLGFSLEYGKETSDGVKLSYGPQRLMPGAETELVNGIAAYNHYRDMIAKEGGSTDFTKAFIGMTYVRFDDGMIWDGQRLPFKIKGS